jgi:SAM-dependent methyltransferase
MAIQRHLAPNARILDIGGGPGRYAMWLAELGYRVVLADLSRELLAVARARIDESPFASNIESIVEVDARDLSAWPDGEFDAALSLGPFYHLPERTDREQAALELRRVVRPGRHVFVALMPRYTFLRRTAAIPEERYRLLDPEFVDQLLRTGVFLNDQAGRFDMGYGVNVSEVVPFFEEMGFTTRELIASEGLGSGLEAVMSEIREADSALYDRLVGIIAAAAADPSVHGLSSHLLYIGVVP